MSLTVQPALGIARVGDSPTDILVTPEVAGGLPTAVDGGIASSLKDSQGRVCRQAARFRVYDGDVEVVVGSQVAGKTVTDIRWTVHLANKKSGFYDFRQLEGEQGYAADAPLRNPEVTDPATRLQTLMIDPGPATVDGATSQASFARDPGSAYAQRFPEGIKPLPIDTLGELRRERDGRLLLLGGFGRSGSTGSMALDNPWNNPGWFDDVSDGPVDAVLVFDDGTTAEVLGAWAVVAPPDFAPGILNQVTLFDVLFDHFVRSTPGFRDDIYADGSYNEAYTPSMPDEIVPILDRAGAYSWVATRQQGAQEGQQVNTFSSQVKPVPHAFGSLTKDDTLQARFVQTLLRPHDTPNQPFQPNTTTPAMPLLAGDNPVTNTNVSKFLTLTQTQQFFIDQWAAGRATDGSAPPQSAAMGLTRGVLDNCVGGPFCPGIEATWIVRNSALWSEPFRIPRKSVEGGLTYNASPANGSEPGDLSQRMAQPWPADFNECSTQDISTASAEINVDGPTVPRPLYRTLWWPAQRPMSVYTGAGRTGPEWWARDASGASISNADMVSQWSKLGFVLDQGTVDQPDFVESERSYTAEETPMPDPTLIRALRDIHTTADPEARASKISALASKDGFEPGDLWQAGAALAEAEPELAISPTKEEQDQITTVNDTIVRRWAEDAEDIACPTTVADLISLLDTIKGEGATLRAVGSARSLSDAPEPGDNCIMVNTGGFAASLTVDSSLLRDPARAQWLYSCGAGRTVKEILEELDPHPDQPKKAMARTLQNMGAGQFQTVVGALSTSTHGSGIGEPSFPQMVEALEWVTFDAGGSAVAQRIEPTAGVTDPAAWQAMQSSNDPAVALIQDDDLFHAALVSMGCMGVIYGVTLKLVPGFYLQEYRQLTTWSALKGQLQSEVAANDYFELVINPLPNEDGDHTVLTSKRNRVASYVEGGKRPFTMWLATTSLGRVAAAVAMEFSLKNPPVRAPKTLHTATVSTQDDGYCNKNYKVLQLNMDVNADSTEQNVDYAKAVDAIDAALQLFARNFKAFCTRFPPGSGNDFDPDTPYHEDPDGLNEAWKAHPIPLSPLGVRFVPANDALMSPMYQRATCTIEMPMPGSDSLDWKAMQDEPNPSKMQQLYDAYLIGRRTLMETLESTLAEAANGAGRPHWGQANYLDRAQTSSSFPGFAPWLTLYGTHNALGVFNGAFTRRLGIDQYAGDEGEGTVPEGKVTGEVIFRHQREKNRGILKVKEDLGWMIYNGMTEPLDTTCYALFPKKCKRMGVSTVASTENLVDPVVAEFRISPTGEIVERANDFKLYHSLASNRQYGVGTYDEGVMVITGDAAAGIVEFINAGRRQAGEPDVPDGPVALKLEDLASGRWTFQRL